MHSLGLPLWLSGSLLLPASPLPSFPSLSFSAWGPLAGTGAGKPKSHPKWRQPTLRLQSLLLSGRPLPGTGPLYIGKARLLHSLGLPLWLSGSLALLLPASPLPSFPSLSFSSFSAWGPLAGTGARRPKSHPNYRQPTLRLQSLLLSGRPLPGTMPLYIGKARLLHSLGLPLWLSGSAASGVPIAFLSLSFLLLLLCLGPSGGDRGPQAQKPTKVETTNPPAPISASLRAPLAGNGAPIYRKSPSVALPWASSLALWLCCFWLSGSLALWLSAASGVPVAFLFLSLLLCLGPSGGDRGPQGQNPPAPISSSLRAPLAGNGAPIYRKSPSVALPWASSLALWLCCFRRPRCLPFLLSPSRPSLLGALWRGPGPASPKATQTRDHQPSGSNLCFSPGAPCRERGSYI